MSKPESSEPYQFEFLGEGPLYESGERFRSMLLKEAAKLAGGRSISEAHIHRAFDNLLKVDPATSRTGAQKTISTAFKENRPYEWVAYGMAVALFVVGIVLLLVGTFSAQETASRIALLLTGSFSEIMLWAPLRFAANCRRNNFQIRVLGILLDRVDDPDTLSRLLRDTFPGLFGPMK